MVLADQVNGAGLWAFFTLVRRDLDSDLTSDLEILEAASDDGVLVEIDFKAVARLHEAVSILREQADNLAMRRGLVLFHAMVAAPRVVLEPAFGCVKSVAQRNVDVLVGMIRGALVVDHELATWKLQADSHLEQLAFVVVLVRCPNLDVAGRDSVVKALEALRAFADARLYSSRGFHVSENNL
jgi:hypothetical protein